MRHHGDIREVGSVCLSHLKGLAHLLPTCSPAMAGEEGRQRFCLHFIRNFVSFLSTVSCFCRIFHENLIFGMLSVIKVMFRKVSSEVCV